MLDILDPNKFTSSRRHQQQQQHASHRGERELSGYGAENRRGGAGEREPSLEPSKGCYGAEEYQSSKCGPLNRGSSCLSVEFAFSSRRVYSKLRFVPLSLSPGLLISASQAVGIFDPLRGETASSVHQSPVKMTWIFCLAFYNAFRLHLICCFHFL